MRATRRYDLNTDTASLCLFRVNHCSELCIHNYVWQSGSFLPCSAAIHMDCTYLSSFATPIVFNNETFLQNLIIWFNLVSCQLGVSLECVKTTATTHMR